MYKKERYLTWEGDESKMTHKILVRGSIVVNEFTMHVMENHRESLKGKKRVWQVEGHVVL